MYVCPLLENFARHNNVKINFGVALLAERLSHLSNEGRGFEIAAVLLSPVTESEQQLDRIRREYNWSVSNKAERIIVSTTCRGSIGWETVTAFLSELIEIQGDSSGSICVTNSNDSCLEQVDDLHKLFSTPGFFSIGLCLDISEFQKAIVNPADAIINFSDRIQAVRIDHQSTFENTVHDSIQLDSVLKDALHTLRMEQYAGP